MKTPLFSIPFLAVQCWQAEGRRGRCTGAELREGDFFVDIDCVRGAQNIGETL